MKKHFCTCTVLDCPHHPTNQEMGCDPCIEKNLEQGEVPTCFWMNVQAGVAGTTEYSMENFSKFCLEHLEKQKV